MDEDDREFYYIFGNAALYGKSIQDLFKSHSFFFIFCGVLLVFFFFWGSFFFF